MIDVILLHFFGGIQVADYCAKRIHEVVAEEWKRLNDGQGWQRRWERAFCDGFERVDNEVIAEDVAPDIVGSTAVVVLVSGCQIICSNCGDSRAVLCRGNQVIQLTVDHKVPALINFSCQHNLSIFLCTDKFHYVFIFVVI